MLLTNTSQLSALAPRLFWIRYFVLIALERYGTQLMDCVHLLQLWSLGELASSAAGCSPVKIRSVVWRRP